MIMLHIKLVTDNVPRIISTVMNQTAAYNSPGVKERHFLLSAVGIVELQHICRKQE